jgi:hypothetical protein
MNPIYFAGMESFARLILPGFAAGTFSTVFRSRAWAEKA